MTDDQFILLINSQWERGLIVPNSIIDAFDQLSETAFSAMGAGLVNATVYHMTTPCTCFNLTRKGRMRLGVLINATVVAPKE